MATHQTSTHTFPTQVKAPRLAPRKEHRQALQGFTELFGTPSRQLLDEAMEEFIFCVLRPRAEGFLKAARKAQRAEQKAELNSKIDDYLAKLERDLN